MDYQRLFARIDKYKIVSFDIFDTLLKRDVCHYEHVFRLIENELCKKGIEDSDFFRKRVEAESRARNKCIGEVTFEDIYDNFIGRDSLRSLYMQLEADMEKALLKTNPEIKKVYDYCVEKNKRIIVISDMYYSSSFLRNILERNGYDKIERIFVSSELKQQKKTGKIFHTVLKQLCVHPDRILHIGDSFRSDYLMPKLHGIAAYHYVSAPYRREFRTIDTLDRFLNNRLQYVNGEYNQIGYKYFGPLLFGFISYLIEQLRGEKIGKVLFCSRDGYIMIKAYKLFELYEKNLPKPSYFYASRRSLQVPLIAIGDNGCELFFKTASFSPYISIREVLNRMGYNGTLENASEQEKIETIKHRIIVSEDLAQVRDRILLNAKQEANAFNNYIRNQGIQSNESIAFIDVGWKGSLQYSFQKLMCLNNLMQDINGFYIGLHEKTLLDMQHSDGFLFSPGRGKENFYTVMSAMSIIELFFSAPHGSVLCYGSEGIVLDKFEYEDSTEYSYELEVIRELQKGALSFVKDFLESALPNSIVNSDIALRYLKELMTKPKKRELEIFGPFRFDGANGLLPIVDWKGWKFYLRKPKEFLVDFSQCGWKVGFLIKAFRTRKIAYGIFKILYKAKKG